MPWRGQIIFLFKQTQTRDWSPYIKQLLADSGPVKYKVSQHNKPWDCAKQARSTRYVFESKCLGEVKFGVVNKHTKKKQEINGKLKVIKEQVILIQWTSRKLKVI